MDVLEDIRQKLLDGKQPAELVKEGYAKSSVYLVAKKVRKVQSSIPELPADDELTELRRRKEIVKLQKEISELEAARDKLPDRVAALETKLATLEGSAFKDRVEDAMCALFESVICAGCGQTGWTVLIGVCAYCGKPLEIAIGVTESRMVQVRAGRLVRKQET